MASEYPAAPVTTDLQDTSNDGPADDTKAQAANVNKFDENIEAIGNDLIAAFALGVTATNITDLITEMLDGDVLDITFNPAGYTPDASPPEATDVDSLAAHLKGISDEFVAITADPNTVDAKHAGTNWNAILEAMQIDADTLIAILHVTGTTGSVTSAMTDSTKHVEFVGISGGSTLQTTVNPIVAAASGRRYTFRKLIINQVNVAASGTLIDLNGGGDHVVEFEDCEINLDNTFANLPLILNPGSDNIVRMKNCIVDGAAASNADLIHRNIASLVTFTLELDGTIIKQAGNFIEVIGNQGIAAFNIVNVIFKNRSIVMRPSYDLGGTGFLEHNLIYAGTHSGINVRFSTDVSSTTFPHGIAYVDEKMILDSDLALTGGARADIEPVLENVDAQHLFVGPGDYGIDQQIGQARQDFIMEGSGRNTVFNIETTTNIRATGINQTWKNFMLIATANSTNAMFSMAANQMKLDNVWFDVATSRSAGTAITVEGGSDFSKIINCRVLRTGSSNGYSDRLIEVLSGCDELEIRDCLLDTSGASSFDAPVGIYMDGNFCKIHNVVMRGEIIIGIQVIGDTLTIDSCTIDQRDEITNTGTGILATGANMESLFITNCIIEQAKLYGIRIGGTGVDIEQCVIYNCKINDGEDESFGIWLDARSAPFSTISHCTIKNDIAGGANGMTIGIKITQTEGGTSAQQRVWVKNNQVIDIKEFSGSDEEGSIVVLLGESVASAVNNGIVVDNNDIYIVQTGLGNTGIVWKGDVNAQVSRTIGGSISGNTIFQNNTGPDDGIRVHDSQRLKINSNEIYGREVGTGSVGIDLINVIDSIVKDNIVQGMDDGFVTDTSCIGNWYANHLVNNLTPETIGAGDTSLNDNKVV